MLRHVNNSVLSALCRGLRLTSGSIMPFLRFTVGRTAAVDEASHIALVTGVHNEARAQLHHVEVGLPLLFGLLHPLLALRYTDHLPCSGRPTEFRCTQGSLT